MVDGQRAVGRGRGSLEFTCGEDQAKALRQEVSQAGGHRAGQEHSPSSASVRGKRLSAQASDFTSIVSTPLITICPTLEPMTDWTPLVTADLVMSMLLCTAPRVTSTAPATWVATVSFALDTELDTNSRAPDTVDDTSSLVPARTCRTGHISVLPHLDAPPRAARGAIQAVCG